MVASLQIGTQAAYYIRRYYHGGEIDLAATWYAPKSKLGVVDGAAVAATTFERLHAGLDVDGRPLLTTTGRTVEALDLTLSTMKGASVAYALTDDPTLRQAILDAHRDAVRATLDMLQAEDIVARRGKGGHIREPVGMTAAVFSHDTSRPEKHSDDQVFADCNIHSHCVIFNIAERADGTVGTIDTRIGRAKMLCGSVYHAHLAHNLIKLGFTISEVGPNGIFEIGVDRDLCQYFSARRERIVATLAEAGLSTAEAPEVAAAAALSTRRTKIDGGEPDRFADWQARARGLGVDPGQLIDALRRDRTDGPQPAEPFARRLVGIPRELTEHEATFSRRELLRAVAVAHVGTDADPSLISTRAAAMIADGHVVALERPGGDGPIYSTPEMIGIERQTLASAHDLADANWRGIDRAALVARCEAAALTEDQAAVAVALGDGRALAFLEGRAGTGKTRTLAPLIEQMRSEGYRVIAAAPAWRTAKMLQDDLGIEARAIDAWLAVDRKGGRFLDGRTVLIVDEAGLLGVRATHALLEAVGRARSGSDAPKLVLVGDRAQLAPITAGSGLDLVGRLDDGARLDAVLRQRDPGLRRAVERLAAADIEAALAELRAGAGLVECRDAAAAVRTAVDLWFANCAAAPGQDHLLLARTHARLAGLNAEIRGRLRARGDLTGPDIVVAAVTPSGKPMPLSIAVGDRLRIGRRVDAIGRGVINGTSVTVEAVQAAEPGHAVVTGRIDGERVSFHTRELRDRHGRARLAHDYAISIFSSQGLTSETCTLLADADLDRRDLYVGMSRSRGAAMLVVDRAAVEARLRVLQAEAGSEAPIGDEERQRGLVAAWSRVRIKTTTLPFPEPESPSAAEAGPSPGTSAARRGRDRSQQRDHAR
ncbi:MobF family relaxase [uncultured Methylobacterium sp.]|uniref:MobF family relaxase n=1 Tax=uncultured Methylobacterium sp. TaxID=157278 RepID=UPI0035CC1251